MLHSTGLQNVTFETKRLSRARVLPAFGVPDWIFPALLLLFALFTLIVPAATVFHRLQINYNEGWNVYNAEAAMHHVRMYATKYDWTTVNYPLASFYFIGSLSHFGGDPLMVGRLVSLASLLLACTFVALIVRRLTGHWASSVFAGAFCLAIFCLVAWFYVGMDDPQMLAQAVLLGGLFLYLMKSGSGSTLAIAAVVAVFVLGGNIKHNPVAAPLAVFFDLCLASKSKAIRFVLFAVVFLGISVAANMLVGGPYFLSKLMLPRPSSVGRALHMLFLLFGTLQIPLALAALWSIWQIRNPKFRVIAFYFLVSFILGFGFTIGGGVNVNAYFDTFFAMSVVMGLLLDYLWHSNFAVLRTGSGWRAAPPLVMCLGLPFTLASAPLINVPKHLHALNEQQRQFQGDVSFIASQPGPALCESLLRCFYAGKPFIYDPFNSGALITVKKLDSREITEQIEEKKFGAIQMETTVAEMSSPRPNGPLPDLYFTSDMLDAIGRFYEIGRQSSNSVIYVPIPDSSGR